MTKETSFLAQLLLVSDCTTHAAEVRLALANGGLAAECRVVSTRDEYRAALDERRWAAVIAKYHLAGFSGTEALALLRARDNDVPFILLSGTIGEDNVAAAIRAGASDYVMTDDLARVPRVIEREFRQAAARRETRRLEHQLRLADTRYRSTFEQAPIGIASANIDGIILDANEYYARMIGKPAEEMIGRHFTTLLHADDVPDAKLTFDAFVADGRRSITYERRYHWASGRFAWTNVTLARVDDEEGNFDYLIVLAEEITGRRDTEETLRSHKALLEEAERLANLGSWEQDLATGDVTMSKQLCRLYGFDPASEPTLEALYDTIHPDDRARLEQARKTNQTLGSSFETEFRTILPDGVHTLQSRGRFVTDAAGRTQRVIGIVQDISERVGHEEALRRIAAQQVAVANVGHMALAGKPLAQLLSQVAALVVTMLEADFSEILQQANGQFTLVAGDGWTEGEPATSAPGGAGSQAAFVLDADQPMVIADLNTESRFSPSPLACSHGAASGVAVRIARGEENAWGVLAVYSRPRRTFTSSDVDFVRAMSILLGQAIERERVETELRQRARQQSAIAELGRAAITSFGEDTLARACTLIAAGLGVDYGTFAELEPDGRSLRHRAGTWVRGLGPTVPVNRSIQLGLTVLSGEAIVVEDYATDGRFSTANTVAAAGITSGLTVPVASATRTFGAVAALSRTTRHFGESDIDFLRSVANIIAESMERDLTQRALAESESRYRSVIDGASEIIFSIAADGTITSLNPAFKILTGWNRDEWIGRPFADLLPRADREQVLARFNDVMNMLDALTGEARIRGRERTLLVEIVTFPEVRDRVLTGVYGFARDITDARRAETERERVTRSLELVLESTADGIYTLDVAGRCTLANAAAARMLGYSASELTRRLIHPLVHGLRADGYTPFSEEDCPIQQVLHGGPARTVTNDVYWRKDGTPLPIDYSVAPIVDAGAIVGAVVAFTDITERRRLEIRLEQANRLNSLGRMAATIAHEFNNVLMGIAPFIEVIRRRPDKAETALEQVSRAVARGKGVTHDILRYTRPAELNRSVFAVEAWLRSVAAEARSVLPPACALELEAVDPLLCVDADPHQFHQIVMNFVINARDAMPGGGTIRIEARREPARTRFAFGAVEHPERFAHLVVSDTGHGIDAETLNHIFEPLFTLKKTGTGLGLAVAHQVVHRHGGEIFAESTPGVGTSFHVFLPLADAAAASLVETETADQETPREPGVARAERRTRVLLVEDDECVAAGIAALLAFESIELDVATTGAAALEAIPRFAPEVVVLDVGLPDMDGTEVYARIAERHPGLPVIFSTGHADRARLDELSPAGGVLYLLKPYESSALLEMVGKARAMMC